MLTLSLPWYLFIVYNQKVTCVELVCRLVHLRLQSKLYLLLQFYNSHFATLITCLRCKIIGIIPRLYFTSNDEWGDRIFSLLGQSGPIKNVHSRSRCCEYSRRRTIPLPFVQINRFKDDPLVFSNISDITLQSYVKSNNFFFWNMKKNNR